MTRQGRSDPQHKYRTAVTWEPARPGIGAAFGEAVLSGSFVAAVIILGDRAVFGSWCEIPAMGLVWAAAVTFFWFRLRSKARPPSGTVEGDAQQPRDRVILINPPDGSGYNSPEERCDGDFVQFVKGCQEDSSLRRWEKAGLSRQTYAEWRDLLIRSGHAEWISGDRRQGWRLVSDADMILDALELDD